MSEIPVIYAFINLMAHGREVSLSYVKFNITVLGLYKAGS